jgi:polyphosphate glucokinase
MKVLVIDVGGTHVKVLLSGEREPRKFESGPKLTARKMVTGVALNPTRLCLEVATRWR